MFGEKTRTCVLATLAALWGHGCQVGDGDPIGVPNPVSSAPPGLAADPGADPRKSLHDPQAVPEAAFPLHGLVTGLQLSVRSRPDPEADVLGWLRIGDRVRLGPPVARTSTCRSGWHPVQPRGFACAGQGIEVGDTPPDGGGASRPPERDAALPYAYWFVKEPMTPEYHRTPSRAEQRQAEIFAERYLTLLGEEEAERAEQLLAGELEDEPLKPAVVHRYLDRGFFVAGVGTETRASRRFVRTVRGRYIKASRLVSRTGPEFRGVELDETTTLPVVWSVREASYRMRREYEGSVRFPVDRTMDPIPRHTVVDHWLRTENIDGETLHVLDTENGVRYVRAWFLSVAEPTDRPFSVAEGEPWVHVDLDQQNLVLYEGNKASFATLISSGQTGYETPVGVFEVHRKYVADTMANVGDGNDDRYSIEDVPWAQYFDRSIAIHGAFWHNRFGLARSHGCVNLAPADARRVFDALWPEVPRGWLGVRVHEAVQSSHVVVTND